MDGVKLCDVLQEVMAEDEVGEVRELLNASQGGKLGIGKV